MEGYAIHRPFMSVVVLDQFSKSCVPNFNGSVYCWSGYAGSVWGKLTAEDFRFMLCKSCRNSCFCNIPKFNTSIIWTAQQKPLVKRNLTLTNPICMPYETLFEFSFQIPHLNSLIWRTAHQKIFLLGKTQLEYRPRVSFDSLVFSITELSHKYTEFFQILISLSSPQDMTFVESALKRTSFTCPLCPTNLKGLIWGLKFHTSTNPSAPPETTCFLNVIFVTSNEKIQRWRLIFSGL